MTIRFEKSESMKIKLLGEQYGYLSSEDKIKTALIEENTVGFDIYDGTLLVGFAMLRKYDEYGWFLWDFAIDRHFQNRGYGTESLKELIAYMKKNYGAKEISTTYIWGNVTAKRLYEKAGFEETDIVDGPGCHEVNLVLKT